jgi:hypothetical protein
LNLWFRYPKLNLELKLKPIDIVAHTLKFFMTELFFCLFLSLVPKLIWIVWRFNKYILARFFPLYNKWVIPNPFLLAKFCQRKKKRNWKCENWFFGGFNHQNLKNKKIKLPDCCTYSNVAKNYIIRMLKKIIFISHS